MSGEDETELNVVDHQPGKFEVSVGLVTSLSTSSNASFEKIVHSFVNRMNEKSAEIFRRENKEQFSPKSSK